MIVVALIVAVFAVVLATGHVDLSGGLTSGDLLVGIGTLGLAWYTAQLAAATYLLDEREQSRQDRQVHGVARLVEKELQTVKRNANAALGGRAWPAWYATPHGAWDRDGTIIAEAVSGEVAESLVVAFSYVGEWEAIVTKYFLLHPEQRGMPAEEGSNEEEALNDLLGVIEPALKNLGGAIALPNGAEGKSGPKPGTRPLAQRWYRRLRRVLFWPRR